MNFFLTSQYNNKIRNLEIIQLTQYYLELINLE